MMKFSEALEQYLKARASLNHPFRADSGKEDDRAVMKKCLRRMDELTAKLAQHLNSEPDKGPKP